MEGSVANLSELYLDDNKYIANTYNRINIDVDYGEGCYLVDTKGDKYLDMYSGISVNLAGHSEKSIINAIIEQSNKYIHLSNNFISKSSVELAKMLVNNTFAKKIFFTNSGTEANETAIKVARKYGRNICSEKTKIISAYNSFHGRTMGSLSLTGQTKYQESFKPLLDNIDYFEYNNAEDLEKKVSDNVCAIFIELIQGEGGIVQVNKKFLERLTILSRKYNFLIVVDEIQTGLGRTGKFLACEHSNIEPDIVTLAKGLGGGLPIGATLLGDKCVEVLRKGDHGSTFAPNPVASAAGVEVLKKILEDGFLDSINEKYNYFIDKLMDMQKMYPEIINNITGKGLMIGIDVGDFAQVIKDRAFENKLLLNVTANKVIRLLPALNISYEELESFIQKFMNIIKTI
ncbi:MAG TPA: aspartate aminotransferase family protein [Clostridiales bacterium]|nr:aspartate aminotransferase family protein [Clostridiales bacterium]